MLAHSIHGEAGLMFMQIYLRPAYQQCCAVFVLAGAERIAEIPSAAPRTCPAPYYAAGRRHIRKRAVFHGWAESIDIPGT
jgi:hypothetical protein